MPPSAEKPVDASSSAVLMPQQEQADSYTKHSNSLKHLTMIPAINYEVSLVDEFVAVVAQKRRTPQQLQQQRQQQQRVCNNSNSLENEAPTVLQPQTQPQTPPPTATPAKTTANSCHRRSARDKGKKKEITTVRARVRYDMQKVPAVVRNEAFLKGYRNSSSRLNNDSSGGDYSSSNNNRRCTRLQQQQEQQQSTAESSTTLTTTTTSNTTTTNNSCSVCRPPFRHDSTVLWIPTKRREWEDCLEELTAVCTSAALRRYLSTTQSHDTIPRKPFLPPLSRDYIRDRVDIDDPLMGFQLRHKQGGWLQGFLMFTNFTTWTHGFRWDSGDPRSGIDRSSDDRLQDVDGTLAAELEALARSGDPLREGIVFPQVAEIGLVGALGCGEYLVRMALEQIRTSSNSQYRYVVLQATDGSKTFYETLGFRRVGAVCRYMGGDSDKGKRQQQQMASVVPTVSSTPHDTNPEDQPLVGYRHWTHANESEISLNLHGGPSYMMCLKLDDLPSLPSPTTTTTPTVTTTTVCPTCHVESTKPTSFLKAMKMLQVDQKPTILPLGNGTVTIPTTPKLRKMDLTASTTTTATTAATSTSSSKRKCIRRASTPQRRKSMIGRRESSAANSSTRVKRTMSDVGTNVRYQPATKRRKLAINHDENVKAHLLSPPKNGDTLTYAQKQYQSAWLAVPPDTTTSSSTASKRSRAASRRTKTAAKTAVGDTNKTNNNKTSNNSNNGRKQYKTCIIGGKERLYHSVRGPDGRFVRIYADENNDYPGHDFSHEEDHHRDDNDQVMLSPSSSRVKKQPNSTSSKSGRKRVEIRPAAPAPPVALRPGPHPIYMSKSLSKQKVRSYPRSVLHYYNRVVKPVSSSKKTKNSYYFVLHYSPEERWIRAVPLLSKSVLSGQRQGRPRYQAVVEETDANLLSASIDDYKVVNATMIMKTPIIMQEAWDVEDDD